MKLFDFTNTIINASTERLKKIAAFNPFTIHKKGSKAKAIFALSLVCILWGTTWVVAKRAVHYVPPLQVSGLRQFIAGTLYVSYFLFNGAKLPKGKEWGPIFILSILNFILSNGLSTWGIKYISAGLASIMGAIFPLWIVIIGFFSSKSKMPTQAVIGLVIGFLGVCVIFYDHLNDFLNADFRFGIFLSLIATWTWAFATVYTKQQAASFNPYFSFGIQMLISGSTLLAFTNFTGIAAPLNQIALDGWLALGYLIFFGSILSFISYLYALQHLPTEQASIYAYINPIVAVLVGAIVYGERVSTYIIIGGLVTLAGVYFVNRAFKAAPAIEQPETEGM